MKLRTQFFCLLATSMIGCAEQSPVVAEPADLVFLGDHILTVDAKSAGANAVAVRGDSIVAVGSQDTIEKWIGKETRVVLLGDRALLPGFTDAHGHLSGVMQVMDLVNASSPPVGPMNDINDIVLALRARRALHPLPTGDLVMGYGYDDSLLAERRHPDRDDLDRVSTEHPVGLMHVSGHLATLNSAALALLGIDANTPDPVGGVIRRRTGSQEPNGVLEETAAMAALRKLAGAGPTPAQFSARLERAIAYHARYGITTIQDGASSPASVAGYRAVAAQHPLPVDVAVYIHDVHLAEGHSFDEIGYRREYENGVRVAGVKFVLDGSPQGRTAWLTKPYAEGPAGAPEDYKAYPATDPDHYRTLVAQLIRAGIPVLAHANGDAAIDLMIEGVAEAVGKNQIDHRSIAIHAQLAREDQLDEMKRLGIIPSFFSVHTYYWGDWHRQSFGDERALRISPLRSARDRALRFTIHNDAPIVPPDIMRLLQAAVERRTRSGFVLGEDQRISFEEALRGVTLDAAYAYFEEDRKGSISPGKQADLVVLAQDPRSVPAAQIGEVAILETIARGQTVYLARR